MFPRYCIPPIVLIDFSRALASVVRGMLRHHTRRPCDNCGMHYCNGTTCRQIAEQRRAAAAVPQPTTDPAALLKPWAATVEKETREL